MDTKGELVRDFARAAGGLDGLLAGCTERDAGIRCGADSRTVVAVANHVAEWLALLASVTSNLASGSAWPMTDEVVREIDAGFAKATAGRTIAQTRIRFRSAVAKMHWALRSLQPDELNAVVTPGSVLVGTFLRRWACDHVDGHAATIRAALLAAPRPRWSIDSHLL